jgi:hypothetical protein
MSVTVEVEVQKLSSIVIDKNNVLDPCRVKLWFSPGVTTAVAPFPNVVPSPPARYDIEYEPVQVVEPFTCTYAA